ncbi:MAG: oligoendopeptidase F [Oscillospiraceae bacterium]|nr:oligoendopeptidase F [Oscillospiraceae bacterium]
MNETVKERSEISEEFKWAVNDIYIDDSMWKKDYECVKKSVDDIKSYHGRLSESADVMLSYFKLSDEIGIKFDSLVNYAHRKRDEDNRNPVYQEMCGQLSALISEISDAGSFEVPEILSVSDEVLEKFFAENSELGLYRLYVSRLKKRKEHTLSESEERIMALAGQMQEAPDTIYSVFSDAELEFEDAVDSEGNRHQVTHGTYIPLVKSSDRVLRESAFHSMYAAYGKYKNTIAAMLTAQTKQLSFNAKARRYESSLHASLDRTDVPVSVYHNLIDAVHRNMEYMYKYVRLRKKLMKLDELHMYDLYTPVVSDCDMKISFEEAKKNVYDALAPMGDEYRAVLMEGFNNRWIDVYENTGKTSGAYSAGAKVHPFVLLNHKDTLNCEFTLAHEMGHAIHSWYSNKTQPAVYSDYVIFVAEVASTCNEALLMEYLLKTTTDKKQKAYLINYFLEQFRTTLYRQTMFAEFELKINQMTENGEGLTAENISELYYNLNRLYFGDDIVIDEDISLEWARIPHFYYDYYVYQYATGYSAAIALSRKILKEGKPAVDNYIKFLSGGCSASPIELLKTAGVDMSTPDPVNAALEIFGELIDELGNLLDD